MKHRYAFIWCCLTALVLLGMRQLVVSPESAAAAAPPPPMRQSAICSALPQTQGASCTNEAETSGRQTASLPCVQAQPDLPQAASCGWQITGKTYVRTVYIAFHLEDKAG